MEDDFPISVCEEAAIAELGGFDRAVMLADQILRKYHIERSLFSRRDRERIIRGRRLRKLEIKFYYNTDKSIGANIDDLFRQAHELQADAGGTHYVGTMLQHLVGAKLDVVLGMGKIQHHGASVADHSTERKADFQVEAVAIHVTTHTSENLVRKCASNLQHGLKPVIITVGESVAGAAFLLNNASLAGRVDVLDIGQFLTANIYERSLFKSADCKVTLVSLLERYNEIVASCETDPSLRIKLDV